MTLLIFVAVLLTALAIGMPIAYALLLTAVALMVQLGFFDTQILAQNLIHGADSFPLMAVPFFILAGEIMNAGGLSRRIVALALALVGHVRGGLGYVAILAGCVLASLSGSAAADAAALSALLVPMMVKAGYDSAQSSGLMAACATIAPVIPPSIALVVLGVAGNVSITQLFLAGIWPGLMMALSLCAVWWLVTAGEQRAAAPREPLKIQLRALRDAFWALLLPVIIIVGLRFGVFTPTEAGVVAAVYALFVATAIYRELSLGALYGVALAAVRVTSMVMFLVAAALVTAWMITIADLPGQLVPLVSPLMDSPILLMLAIVALVIVVGTAMDMVPLILILVPVLMPVAVEAGIDPVYFGVVFVMACSIGLVTPPLGTVLNVVAGVSKLSIVDVVRGAWPFLLAEVAVVVLLVLFPILLMGPASYLIGR